MKWDIDREIAALEPDFLKGTTISRILMEVGSMKRDGVKPTPEQVERGHGTVWCLGLGQQHLAKAWFYGQTIREAFLKARKAHRENRLTEHTPWDRVAGKLVEAEKTVSTKKSKTSSKKRKLRSDVKKVCRQIRKGEYAF